MLIITLNQFRNFTQSIDIASLSSAFSTKLPSDIINKFTSLSTSINKITTFNDQLDHVFSNIQSIPDNISVISSHTPSFNNFLQSITSSISNIATLQNKLSILKQFNKLEHIQPSLSKTLEFIKSQLTLLSNIQFPSIDEINKLLDPLLSQLDSLIKQLPLDWVQKITDSIISLDFNINDIDLTNDIDSNQRFTGLRIDDPPQYFTGNSSVAYIDRQYQNYRCPDDRKSRRPGSPFNQHRRG